MRYRYDKIKDNIKYVYRNLPKDCVPPRYLWAVKGIDTHSINPDNKILEYCTSRNDADYVIINMMKDKSRFLSLSIEEHPEKITQSDPVELYELMKTIPSDSIFKDDSKIELYLNYGAFMNIPIRNAEFRKIYGDDLNNPRPALILETDDYNPGQSKGVHY